MSPLTLLALYPFIWGILKTCFPAPKLEKDAERATPANVTETMEPEQPSSVQRRQAGRSCMSVMSHQQQRYGNISFTYPTKQAPTLTLQNL